MAVHPTAIIEPGVSIGRNTSIWDNVHVRHSTAIGSNCIIGEKSYIAYGVAIKDFVKINAFVYVCTGVTIERGVMIAAGVVFTNERFPRATTPQLDRLQSSDPNEYYPAHAGSRRRDDRRESDDRPRFDDRPVRNGRNGIRRDP